MTSRQFAPLFWTQFLSAFNDNFLKNTLVFLIMFQMAAEGGALVAVAGGIFILPFLLLSAIGGELADKHDKAVIAEKLKRVEHHDSHAANAYYTSGFAEALIVTLDGYGSGLAGSVSVGRDGRIERLHGVEFPHSLGTFYESVTSALGFKPSRSAAPPVPRIRHPLPSSTLRMWAISTSTSLLLFDAKAAGNATGAIGMTSGPFGLATIIARSTTLRSSRTLPGHECCCSSATQSLSMLLTGFPKRFENSSTKRQTRSGMSPGRSRSGGTRTGKTLSR